ncbi:hypothetical protein BGZ46_002023 [Entomortierella lignicola]|nr:hypothetical protein BGZ46_002023 [Entomortierella lignicola]
MTSTLQVTTMTTNHSNTNFSSHSPSTKEEHIFDHDSFYSSIPDMDDDTPSCSTSTTVFSDNDIYAGIKTLGAPTIYSKRTSSYNYSNNSNTNLSCTSDNYNNNNNYNNNYYNNNFNNSSYSTNSYLTPWEIAEIKMYNASLGSRSPYQVVELSNFKLNNDIFSSKSLSIHRRILVKNLLSLLYTINPMLEWADEEDDEMDFYDELEDSSLNSINTLNNNTTSFPSPPTTIPTTTIAAAVTAVTTATTTPVQTTKQENRKSQEKRQEVESSLQNSGFNNDNASSKQQEQDDEKLDFEDEYVSSQLPRPRSTELPQSLNNYLSTVFNVDWSVSEDSLFTFGGSTSSSSSTSPPTSPTSSLAPSLGSYLPAASSNPNRRSRSSLSLSSTPWETEASPSSTTTLNNLEASYKEIRKQDIRHTTDIKNTPTRKPSITRTPPNPPEKDLAWLNGTKDLKALPPKVPDGTIIKNKDVSEGRGVGITDLNKKNSTKQQNLANGLSLQSKPKVSTVTRKSTIVPGRRSSLQHTGQAPVLATPVKRVNKSEGIIGVGSNISLNGSDVKTLNMKSEPIAPLPLNGSSTFNSNNTSGVGQEITDSPKPSFSRRKSSAVPPLRQQPLLSPATAIQRDSDNKSVDSEDVKSNIAIYFSFILQPAPVSPYSSNGSNRPTSTHNPPQAPRHLSISPTPGQQAYHNATSNSRSAPLRPPIRISSISITGAPILPPIFPTQHEEPVSPPSQSASPQAPSSIHIRSKSDTETKPWSYTTFHSAVSLPGTLSASSSSSGSARPPLPKRANTSYILSGASKSSPSLTTTGSLDTSSNHETYQRPLPIVPVQYRPQQQQQQLHQQNRMSRTQAPQPHSIRQSYQHQQQPQPQQQQVRLPVKGIKNLARSNTKDLNMDLPLPPTPVPSNSPNVKSGDVGGGGDFSEIKSKLLSNTRWLGAKTILGLKIGQSGK